MPNDLLEAPLRAALAPTGRVTTPRLLCLGALRGAEGHLTGQQIVDVVRDDVPSIKLSTVYRTMELFLEHGLAHRVDGFHGCRYGADTGHAHVVCLRCDSVTDLDPLDPGLTESLGQYLGPAAAIANITVQTTCRSCALATRANG